MMKKLLLVMVMLALGTGWSVAQEPTVTLVPVTDSDYQLSGVVPEGWTSLGRGLYRRAATAGDVTLFGMQSAPFPLPTLMDALLPQLGLAEAPEANEQLQTEAFLWNIYQVDVPVNGQTIKVDLALAEANDQTYLVILQTTPEDYAVLHTTVFVPAVEALQPLAEVAQDLPYGVEEVTFTNGEVALAGTLTLPEGKGPFAAVVLVSGSGPQDRDESIGAMKPLGLVADALTRAGMAVLRYDDRGVGGSGGDIFATIDETTADAAAALAFLEARPDINGDELGVLGHSEGGIVAAALGATDPNLDFIIVLAGPGVSAKAVLLEQGRRILKAEGGSDEMVDKQASMQPALWQAIENDDREAFLALAKETTLAVAQLLPEADRASLGDLDAYAQQSAEQQADSYFNRWFRSFLVADPSLDWAKTTLPVLAVFGGKDVQVPADQNAPALESALKTAGNTDYSIVTLANANHLFQQAESGALSEYETLEPVLTPDLVPTLVDWLKTHITLQPG